MRAHVWCSIGQVDRAIDDFSQAIHIDPANRESGGLNLATRGQLLIDQGNETAGLADYALAMRLFPREPDAYMRRADFYYDRDNWREAIADYAILLQVVPRSRKAIRAIGGNMKAERATDQRYQHEALRRRGYASLRLGESLTEPEMVYSLFMAAIVDLKKVCKLSIDKTIRERAQTCITELQELLSEITAQHPTAAQRAFHLARQTDRRSRLPRNLKIGVALSLILLVAIAVRVYAGG